MYPIETKTESRRWLLVAMILMALMMVSCEKVIMDDGDGPDGKEMKGNVRIKVTGFTQTDFTRSPQNISDVCTRLNFAFFQGESKVKTLSQTASDEKFGDVSVSLGTGKYKMVIVAHSGNGAATITSPSKVTFADNKMTDTFLYCDDIEVSADGSDVDVQLRRVVAMFRLRIMDDIPSSVTRLKFYYTGGSSTLSATTGLGIVESKQTEYRTIEEGQHEYDVYTVPHAKNDELKVTVTALDAEDNPVKEQVFTNVPVTVNKITQYAGDFFGSGSGSGNFSFTLTVDDEWEDVIEKTF